MTRKSHQFQMLLDRLKSTRRTLTDFDRVYAYLALAALLTMVIECLSHRSLGAACIFLVGSPLAFLTNYALTLVTLLPALLFHKRTAFVTMLSSLWLLLGVTQCVILCVRVTPLTAADLTVALDNLSIIGAYLSVWQIVLIALALVGLVVGLVFLFLKTPSVPRKGLYFLKTLISVLLTSILVVAAGFGSGQLSTKFPNLANAYQTYGFPYCFTMSLVDTGVDRPIGYDEGLVSDILEDLSELVTEPEEVPDRPATSGKPNVIIVQLESFFDVKYMMGVRFSEDPIPTFTALKQQYPSGLLNVPVFGAGTVNTEFEVLTGMNMADFGAGEYPFRSVIREKTCETIAYDLLASGYATHAIHNHEGSFYLRNEVYPNLGFQSFTSIEYFPSPTFNETGWAHDALLTDEILYLLRKTPEPDLVFAVSVQGHGKYPDEYLPQDTDVRVVSGIQEETVLAHFNYFINQLREMDDFIQELYQAVMALEEDTVLLLYGDHLPNIARDEGISLSTGLQQTEYILISNYETPVSPLGGERATYELFPLVLETIGNRKGIMNRFHRAYRNDPEFLSLLATLEYDILYGERMFYNDTTYDPIPMTMGSRPIRITDCYTTEEGIYVKGEGFTAYAVVTLNGRAMDTVLVDSNTLFVECDFPQRKLKQGMPVTVRIQSASNKILSETPPFTP